MNITNGNIKKTPNASGYGDAGASTVKRSLQGFIARSGAPFQDIDFHNRTLRQRARMLTMSTPLAASAINTNRTKVVGTGLHMRCAVNREILGLSEEQAIKWQKKTEAEWEMWAGKKRRCDALGLNNFYGLQQLAIKAWLTSGDVFALFKRYEQTKMNPYTLRIHMIEADRVATPADAGTGIQSNTLGKNPHNGNRIFDGVEVDKNNRVVAYHIRSTYPVQLSSEKTEWYRIPAVGEETELPNILHIMDAERPDQYRGVTYLAQAIEPLLQLRRYTEAQLMAAIIQSFYTAWIVTEAPSNMIPMNEVGGGGDSGALEDISESENEYELGPGTVMHLKEGEKIEFGNPNIPTAGFDVFFKEMCKQIGCGLEMPYDIIVKEFNSSYSSAKGALEEAWEAFKMRRVWLVDDFCQPTYETWLAEAVAIGRIKAPGFWNDPLIREAWCGAHWYGPAQTHLDPVKEATANKILVTNGWKTNEQVAREHYDSSFNENVEELKKENQKLNAAMPKEEKGYV